MHGKIATVGGIAKNCQNSLVDKNFSIPAIFANLGNSGNFL
jgi:hypothetical protein